LSKKAALPTQSASVERSDDLVQPIDLGLARRQHRLQGGGIIR
jgi:hypothetical protein